MARNAAAIPQLVRMNCRRLKPSRRLLTSASALMRSSTRFCVALWGGGRYSPFDTIWVGIGVAADASSAPATRRCSRSLSQLPIVVLPHVLIDQGWSTFGRSGHGFAAKVGRPSRTRPWLLTPKDYTFPLQKSWPTTNPAGSRQRCRRISQQLRPDARNERRGDPCGRLVRDVMDSSGFVLN